MLKRARLTLAPLDLDQKFCVEFWLFLSGLCPWKVFNFLRFQFPRLRSEAAGSIFRGFPSVRPLGLVYHGTESDGFMYLYILYLYTGKRTRCGRGANSKLLFSPFTCRSLSAEFPSARLASWVRTFLSGHRFSQSGGWCPQVQARAVD